MNNYTNTQKRTRTRKKKEKREKREKEKKEREEKQKKLEETPEWKALPRCKDCNIKACHIKAANGELKLDNFRCGKCRLKRRKEQEKNGERMICKTCKKSKKSKYFLNERCKTIKYCINCLGCRYKSRGYTPYSFLYTKLPEQIAKLVNSYIKEKDLSNWAKLLLKEYTMLDLMCCDRWQYYTPARHKVLTFICRIYSDIKNILPATTAIIRSKNYPGNARILKLVALSEIEDPRTEYRMTLVDSKLRTEYKYHNRITDPDTGKYIERIRYEVILRGMFEHNHIHEMSHDDNYDRGDTNGPNHCMRRDMVIDCLASIDNLKNRLIDMKVRKKALIDNINMFINDMSTIIF